MEKQLLNPGDVAEILQISKASAYLLLKRGEIPIVQIGKMVRVKREELERYIYEKTRLGAKEESSATHVADTCTAPNAVRCK